MTARRYIIGHRQTTPSRDAVSFLTPFVEIGWHPLEANARRFHTEAEARDVLALMEPSRTGTRFIAEEIRLSDGTLAHRELAESDSTAPDAQQVSDSISADANLYFERWPEDDA